MIRYLNLLKMGMPMEHVRLKMSSEGIGAISIEDIPQPSTQEQVEVTNPLMTPYLRMVHIGVPIASVKQKMIIDGMDPSLLNQ